MQKRSSLCKDALFSVSMGTCSAWLKKKKQSKTQNAPIQSTQQHQNNNKNYPTGELMLEKQSF